MTPIGYNLNFIHNKEHFTNDDQVPYTKALVGLMMLTGIHRLFEKEDVYELIKRAQILLPEQRVIDRFFSDDSLFTFKYENVTYQFTLVHLKALIGLEGVNNLENHIPLTQWESNINHYIMVFDLSIQMGTLKGLELSSFESIVSPTSNGIEIDMGKKVPTQTVTITSELLKQAAFLGETIANDCSEDLFKRIKIEFPNKIKSLELRRMPFNEPEFNFEAYSLGIQRALWKHFWPDMEHFNDPDEREQVIALIYLAWLWANDFVVEGLDGFCDVDSRIKTFDLDKYELHDGGFNLRLTYDEHVLDELAPILHNPEVAKLAVRPWEALDVYLKNKYIT